MSFKAIAVFAVLTMVAGPGYGLEPPPPETPSEVTHYLRLFQGKPIAVLTKTVYEAVAPAGPRYPVKAPAGTKLIRTVTETRQRLVVSGHSKSTTSTLETITDDKGRGLYLREVHLDNRSPRETEVTFGGGEVVFLKKMPGSSEKRTAAADTVYFELDGFALKGAGKLAPGRGLTARVAAVEQCGLAKLEAKVVGKRTDKGGKDVYLIEVGNVGGKGMTWEILSDGEGRTLELSVGAITTKLVTKNEAKLPLRSVRISNELKTGSLGVRPASARKMVLLVKIENDMATGAIPEAPGQAVAKKGGNYVVVITQRRPDGGLPSVDLSAADRRSYTASTAMFPSSHPSIRAAARRAAGSETEPLLMAGRLSRYVARRLANSGRGAAAASALEALRQGRGDCTEHAALMVALARAKGIPARRVSGLVHGGTSFIFHDWAEVYIDDRWIPCDPSKGTVGLPACYLRLGHGSEHDADYKSRVLIMKTGATVEVIGVE